MGKPLKILILLLYYDRPNMVCNALKSIKDLNYSDWELAFIDDGSAKPGKPAVERYLSDSFNKIKFYNSYHTPKDKIAQGGSHVGKLMNQAIKESDAELAIMLCDDDALHADYFTDINKWFESNPNKFYAYSKVILFDPFVENPPVFDTDYVILPGPPKTNKLNRFKNRFIKTTPVMPVCALDASQVAWRTSCNKQDGIWFPHPKTVALDAAFYRNLCDKYGPCFPMKCIGQYKAMYSTNLSNRSMNIKNTKEIYSATDLPD